MSEWMNNFSMVSISPTKQDIFVSIFGKSVPNFVFDVNEFSNIFH